MATHRRVQQTHRHRAVSSTSSSANNGQHTARHAASLSLLRPIELVSQLLLNNAHIWKLAGLLFLAEIVLNVLIIKKIPYTEIDWVAYMQEVSGYLKGETDYLKLRGGTGPLVYPAGFVYIYSALYFLTDQGINIWKGQWGFMGLYLLTLGVVFKIYSRDKTTPPYVLILVCISRRLHSIYVLRLFNDPVAMFFVYSAILAFFLAVSVKMNILLFFPAFGFLIWQTQGVIGTIAQLIIMLLIQILLSLPFTLHHPESYISKAFEFSRVFEYKWTVNWKFLDEKTFLSNDLSKLLLVSHLVVLFAFVIFRWSRSEGGIIPVILRGLTAPRAVLSIHAQYMKASHVLTLFFTSNFIGIMFARSLHYQFYSWYYMTLPYLLWQTRLPIIARLVLLGVVEWAWNVFPATPTSSALLLASHTVLLAGLWSERAPQSRLEDNTGTLLCVSLPRHGAFVDSGDTSSGKRGYRLGFGARGLFGDIPDAQSRQFDMQLVLDRLELLVPCTEGSNGAIVFIKTGGAIETGDDMSQEQQEQQEHLEEDIVMDDLLSDESDNDDVVDDEAELASLLRSQNLSVDYLLPTSSTTQTHSAILGRTATSTNPFDPEEWMRMMERQYQVELQHELELPATRQASSGDVTDDGSILPAGPEDMADLHDDHSTTYSASTPATGVAASDDHPVNANDETTAEPTVPELVSSEENARLTSIIREQATKSLAVNRDFQKVLAQQLQLAEKAYARNKELRAQLQAVIDRQREMERAPVVVPATKARVGPPYFKDHNGDVPPDNEDAARQKRRPLIVPTKAKRWTREEREQLKKGVISENKRILFEEFSETGNQAGILSLDTVSDLQMMLNTKGLDWTRISRLFVDTRSPSECLIQWTGHDHPGINRELWTREEMEKLDELAQKYQERNWIQIALDLDTNRTAVECFRKYHSKMTRAISKDVWTKSEELLLVEAVRVLGDQNWQQVSYCFENRTPAQCMHHWTKCINPAIRRGRWMEEEDGALRAALKVYGEGRWTKIQQHILGRTDVQCRERYMNVLSPNVKTGSWSIEEINKLEELVKEHGQKKWALIASKMDGRTDNQCARRYRMKHRDEKQKEPHHPVKPKKVYFSFDRRKGKTTISQHPDPSEHSAEIRKAAARIRRRQKFEENLKRKLDLEKLRVIVQQDKTLQTDLDYFLDRQRYIYDLWRQLEDKYVDPVEKVFNLGVPLAPKSAFKAQEGRPTGVANQLPDSSASLRPGVVRPVPPCVATVDAFSRLLQQGEYAGGRFGLQRVFEDGQATIHQPSAKPLSLEEQRKPEYIELSERFESVFMWPMLMGMLHMQTARDMVAVPKKVNRKRRARSEQEDSGDNTRARKRKPATRAVADLSTEEHEAAA
ncbi:dolichyl-P-Man:Man(5)GlcNAc(2)-PP-dolichol alpha-1,3-mannosyltransferase [Mortierella claussenii]|nr:dolichyl-P-Man:Man(5)GlcNAc(2)-PP-dolichol alpha-1,3-mannosyltransferase [Mortierella claussenii]